MTLDRTIILDTETRAVEDVTVVGPARYFEDPYAEVLCACWSFGLDEEIHTWHCATEGIEESPYPSELFRRIEQSWLVEAHNVMFERRALELQQRRRRWPAVPVSQLRCSAARAAYHALPRSLEALAAALKVTEQKDPEGKKLIRELSSPIILDVPKKKKGVVYDRWQAAMEDMEDRGSDSAYFWLPDGRLARWNENSERIQRNWEYCRQDVRTEKACSLAMPELPECELAVWRMDQEMNYRGVKCDVDLAKAAIAVADAEIKDLNRRMHELTGIEKGSQRDKVRAWLNTKLNVLPSMKADIVDKVLDRPGLEKEHPEFFEVLTLYRKINRTSVAKYKAALLRVCADERVRDTLVYSSTHTTRWASRGLQVQNYPRGAIKHIDTAAEVIKNGDREWARFLYGDVMLLLSHALRGMFVSGESKELWVADYAAIEARVGFWLAGCDKALQIFHLERQGIGNGIYCDMASKIYGFDVTKDNKNERQYGKQAILSLEYGAGFCKFLIICRGYGITFTRDQVIKLVGRELYFELGKWIMTTGIAGGFNQAVRAGLASPRVKPMQNVLLKQNIHELILCKYVVDLYRTEYEEVPAFWRDQESAAIEAIRSQGFVEAGLITWEYISGRVPRLVARLPSGREQTYWYPQLPSKSEKEKAAKLKLQWEEDVRKRGGDPELEVYPGPIVSKLRYMEVDEGTFEFLSTHTFGGKLMENLTSHVSRDIMADAMVRVERHKTYQNILCVHDEPVAEAVIGEGNKGEFESLIAKGAEWAKSCPIDVEVSRLFRYKKA